MVWYKVAWIDPLFAAVNTVAPNRGHDEDGTIGDLVHASGVSGHNPDDTPGVTAERQDADSKPEVRAADVDSTGSWPAGVSMESVVQAVLHGPAAERDRLIYIIFNRRIWKKSNGWRQETYTGADPHDIHAHFSGDPASDDDGRAWSAILHLGADMDAYQNDTLNNIDAETASGAALAESYEVHRSGQKYTFPNKQSAAIKKILSNTDALVAGGGVSQDALNAAIRSAFTDPAVIAPLAAAVAPAVADLLAARLQA